MEAEKDKAIAEEILKRLETKYSKELGVIKAILAIKDLDSVFCKS